MMQLNSDRKQKMGDKPCAGIKAGFFLSSCVSLCFRGVALCCVLYVLPLIAVQPLAAQNAPESAELQTTGHIGQPPAPNDAQESAAKGAAGSEAEDETAVTEDDAEQDYFDEEETGLDIKFGGVIETVHGVQLMQPFHYAASRISAALFTDVAFQNTSARIAATADYNHLTPKKTGFTLQEAYCTYRADNWDMSIGRQFISWGQADGFRITDRLTARDLREAVAAPDKNIASDAVRFRLLHDSVTFETVFVPFFTPDVLPPFDFEFEHSVEKKPFFTIDTSDSGGTSGVSLTKKLKPAVKPRRFIDTEAAARIAFFLPVLDFSISGFYGWDKTPRFNKVLSILPPAATVVITPEYYRIGTAGFDAAIPAGDFVFRFEAAGVFDKYFEQPASGMNLIPPPVKKNQLLLLAGFDWNRSGWLISMQYLEDLVFCKKDELTRGIHEGTVSLALSKTLLRERLKLAASGLVDVTDGGTASSYSVSYTLSDLLTISGGADVYTKGRDKNRTFARLHTATSGWLKARLSF